MNKLSNFWGSGCMVQVYVELVEYVEVWLSWLIIGFFWGRLMLGPYCKGGWVGWVCGNKREI